MYLRFVVVILVSHPAFLSSGLSLDHALHPDNSRTHTQRCSLQKRKCELALEMAREYITTIH